MIHKLLDEPYMEDLLKTLYASDKEESCEVFVMHPSISKQAVLLYIEGGSKIGFTFSQDDGDQAKLASFEEVMNYYSGHELYLETYLLDNTYVRSKGVKLGFSRIWR